MSEKSEKITATEGSKLLQTPNLLKECSVPSYSVHCISILPVARLSPTRYVLLIRDQMNKKKQTNGQKRQNATGEGWGDHRLALVTPNLSNSASGFTQLVQEVPSRAGVSNSITDGAETQSSFRLRSEHS